MPFLLANTHFGSEWFSDVLAPPFPSLHCWLLGMEQLSHQTQGGRQEQWSELPKLTSSDPVPLCLHLHSEQDALHCALAPCCSGDVFPPAADKRSSFSFFCMPCRKISFREGNGGFHVHQLAEAGLRDSEPSSAHCCPAGKPWLAAKPSLVSASRACAGQTQLLVMPPESSASVHSPGTASLRGIPHRSESRAWLGRAQIS